MKIFGLMLILLSLPTRGDDFFLSDFQNINQSLAQSELEKYLKSPYAEGVGGPIIESLLPAPNLEESEQCLEIAEPKSTRYEVVLVAEGSSDEDVELEILPGQKGEFRTIELRNLVSKVPYTNESTGLKSESVLKRAEDLWKSGEFTAPKVNFDPHHPMGRELFIESLVHAAAASSLPEKELTKSMAKIISGTYKSDEEKFQVLSAYSLRLYRNYNNARNPGYNNSNTNPFGVPIPEGDLTANQILQSTSKFDVYGGGVCNDISESVAMVGEHLFPNRDVLTVNSGSHFGVVVTDGVYHRVIDGGTEYQGRNRLMLVPEMSPTNLRISQVRNGALKEIAVVDTEMNQLTEAAFQTGKKLLKTDADISSLVLHLNKGNFKVAAGKGDLSNSSVMIVVAKYETSSDKFRGYVGLGTTAQKYGSGQETKYQVHFKTGAEKNLFHYLNKSTELKVTSGIHANYTHTINPYDWGPGKYKLDMSAGLDWVNRLDVSYEKVRGSIQTEHALGPSNWGNTAGAISYIEPSDIKPLFKNMSFHLNQVNADVEVKKELARSITGSLSAAYQGSNIGQKVSVQSGITVKAPEGAQILIFTGYSNSGLKGYKTKHSLLAGPRGGEAGLRLTTKKGIEVETKVQRTLSGKPSIKATISVPLLHNSGR